MTALLAAIGDGLPGREIVHAVRDALAAVPVGNPSAPALRAIALQLAAAAGHEAAQADPRVLVAVTRELRATLTELAPPTKGGAADDDDPFDFSGLFPTVGDSTAG